MKIQTIVLFISKLKHILLAIFFQNKMDKDEYSTLFNITWKEGSGHYPPNSVTLTMEMKMIRDWIYTFQEWRGTETKLENDTEREEIISRYKERKGAENVESLPIRIGTGFLQIDTKAFTRLPQYPKTGEQFLPRAGCIPGSSFPRTKGMIKNDPIVPKKKTLRTDS